MAFEGDLSNLSLGDVLQTIAMGRQVGTFVIKGVEERRLACGEKGVALLSTRSSLGLRIGTVLVGTGKVSQEQLDQALKVQRRRRDLLIGQILVEAQACSADDVRAAHRYLAAEEIFDLFLWKQGTFEFIAGEPAPEGPFADLWFDVGSLAMEAARRIDELPRAMETVPPGEVFVPSSDPGPKAADVAKNRDLAALFALMNGRRTAVDVQEAYYRGKFDTWKGMETLVEWKLVRPATLDELLDAARAAQKDRDHIRAARLYRRAAEHQPEDDGIRQSVADALRDSGDKRLASTELVHLGDARLAAGKGLPSIEAYRQAISLDPTNAEAQEGLMRALAEGGLVDEAVRAAQAATTLRISAGEFAGACAAAEAGLAQRPGDVPLLISLANAKQGLGDSQEALHRLDDVAQILELDGDGEHRLLDVYRRILQIDPQRKDCIRRIDELQAFERTRRKRLMQRVAIGCGVLILAMAAVPLLRKPTVESILEKARALADSKHVEGLEPLMLELAERGDATADETIEINGLKARVDQILHPPESASVKQSLDARLEECYDAATKAIDKEHLAEGLKSLLDGLDVLDDKEARRLKALDATSYQALCAESAHEVQNAVGAAATAAQRVQQRVTQMRDRFVDDVWKREDPDVLHELVVSSGNLLASVDAAEWAHVAELVQTLAKRAGAPKDGADKKAADATAGMLEAHRVLSDLHDKALSRARRKDLKDAYLVAHVKGQQLESAGELEEALALYESFLGKCDALKKATPPSLYRPICADLFDLLRLDQLVASPRDRIVAIKRDEAEAQRAESEGDVKRAFAVRKRLVEESPAADFGKRYQMPLRVETAPPGAEVFLLDGTPGGQDLGATPLDTHYPVAPPAGGMKFEVRLAGYRRHEFVRKGAVEDAAGVEHVELPKIACWTSKPCGTLVAPPTAAADSLVVAGRDGVVRRLDAQSGEELARADLKLISGFAGAAVVRGDRVFAAAFDGKGFVLRLSDLSTIATFETGPVLVAPLSTPAGVLVVEDAESGMARLVNDDGRVLWTKQVGRTKCEPAAVGGRAAIVNANREILLLDLAHGEIVERRPLGGDSVWGPPAADGNRIFVADEGGRLVCLDAGTLAESWSKRLDGVVVGRVGVTALQVVACTSGAVHVLDAETGAVLSKTPVEGKLVGVACDIDGAGFVVLARKEAAKKDASRRFGAVATRFDVRGEVVWRYDVGEDVASAPSLLLGAVVLTTTKGAVVSLAR